MKTLVIPMFSLAATLLSGTAFAAKPVPPLVSPGWIATHSCKPGVVTLDVRNPIGGGNEQTYLRGHIPCAVYSDYAQNGLWRQDIGGAPGMVPPISELRTLIGGLGIDNRTHVVIYTAGTSATDMASAARVFWTFKYLGDNNVSILNGGYAAYIARGRTPLYPVQTGLVKPIPKTFKTHVKPRLLATEAEVERAMRSHVPLVDNRPSSQYLGVNLAPVDKRRGTIPGAHNVPESWLTINDGGVFRTPAELTKFYKVAGVPIAGTEINFCNTAQWAALGWFASYELLGNKKAKLYTGSMSQWSRNPALPIEKQIN
ncbi:sulfurtransferase [Acidiphilium acidophilum]|uniref:sulfurtransferase n=1 Tax=Acidiphilium acidophilum TaxID=76588 RepID=UPI002E8E7485|nr:sulfurtransferase [Acidiphilium acidophilum]